MNGLRLYGRMLAVSMRSQLQYRASFLLTTLGNFISAFADFLGIWAFFDRFGGLQGWTLAETAIFYGIGNVSFALSEMFAREFDVFGSHVRTGSFDRMLLRPRSTVLQMMGAQCQIMRIGRLIQGAGVLAAGVWLLRPAWGVQHWLLLLASIIGGTALFFGLIIMQATCCFWTVESLEIWNCVSDCGRSVAQYPLDIYEKPLRHFFTYLVPLACMSYWPGAYLLGRGYVPAWVSFLAPCAGILIFLLSIWVWNCGIRHYRSCGS